jgi:hypothetical protein
MCLRLGHTGSGRSSTVATDKERRLSHDPQVRLERRCYLRERTPDAGRSNHADLAAKVNLWLRSTLKAQCGKVGFIVKSGIGLGDLRLCLL